MEHLYKKIRLVLHKYSLISLHLNSCIFQQCMQIIHQCFEKLLSEVSGNRSKKRLSPIQNFFLAGLTQLEKY